MTPEIAPLFALPYGPLVIFVLRVVDVSLDMMRVLLAVRGQRWAKAAGLTDAAPPHAAA